MKKSARTFTAADLRKVALKFKQIESEITNPTPRVIKGNHKTGKIPVFNMPALMTCPNCKACKKNCYAVKDYLNNRSRTVITSHLHNYLSWTKDPESVEKCIRKFLTKNRPAFFRIHGSGDFFSKEYAEMWYRIARDFPEINFLAFTKAYEIVRGVPFYTLDNMSLVLSAWTDELIPPADLLALYPTSRAVKELSDVRDNEIICPGACETCGMCWRLAEIGKNVAFEIH